jgi:hypothetical protein
MYACADRMLRVQTRIAVTVGWGLRLLACDPLPPAAEEVRERARARVPAHEL